MKTGTDRRELRGTVAARERRNRRKLVRRWQNHPGADYLVSLVVTTVALVMHRLDVYTVAATRDQVSAAQLGLLGVFAAVFAFTLAAVTFGWRLRPRAAHMSSEGVRNELKRSWTSVLWGTAAGLLLLAASWVGDLLFQTGWLAWVSMAASVLVVLTTARALWLLTRLIELSD